MSAPNLELFIGGRSILAYNPLRDGNSANARAFGHGQTLGTLTVSRSYDFVYTIGSRRITTAPYGKFSVSWGTEFILSAPEVLCLIFGCEENNFTPGAYDVRDCPKMIELYAWLQGCPTANTNLHIRDAVIESMSISVGTERPPVRVSVSGVARDISLGTAPAPPSSLPLPNTIYTFAGAKLFGEGIEIPTDSVELSIDQGTEVFYAIGSDRFVLPYHAELELSADISLPSSTYSVHRLQRLLEDRGIEGLRLELQEYDFNTSAFTNRRLVFELLGINRIQSFNAPLSNIGLNDVRISLRFANIKLSVVNTP